MKANKSNTTSTSISIDKSRVPLEVAKLLPQIDDHESGSPSGAENVQEQDLTTTIVVDDTEFKSQKDLVGQPSADSSPLLIAFDKVQTDGFNNVIPASDASGGVVIPIPDVPGSRDNELDGKKRVTKIVITCAIVLAVVCITVGFSDKIYDKVKNVPILGPIFKALLSIRNGIVTARCSLPVFGASGRLHRFAKPKLLIAACNDNNVKIEVFSPDGSEGGLVTDIVRYRIGRHAIALVDSLGVCYVVKSILGSRDFYADVCYNIESINEPGSHDLSDKMVRVRVVA